MHVSRTMIGALALAGMLPVTCAVRASAPPEPNELGASPRTTANIQRALEPQTEHFHPERLLVRFQSGVTRQGKQAVHYAAGAKGVVREYHIVDGLQLVYVPEDELADALASYNDDPAVLYAELDYVVHVADIPYDPDFDLLWGLHNTGQTVNGDTGTPGADIQAVEAWDIWTGDADFRVAVIDTGVNYDHPDLVDNIWTNPGEIPGNELDDDDNGYVDDVHGYDFCNRDGDPMDDHGHGSHVAGTIGAVANNGVGVVGVNWQCSIVALKFIDAGGSGYIADGIEAIQYAVDNNIKVSNNSWISIFPSESDEEWIALRDAILASQSIGHILVAAAGNGGPFFGNPQSNDLLPFYPASYDLPNIIAVAATNNDDDIAAFSNYGPTSVDLGAPGVTVYSTVLDADYEFHSGTSMATPHVVGVVALVMSRSPGLSWQEVRDRVLLTARPIDALKGITVTGGVVNALGAIGDCNGNGVLDDQDIAGGTSGDCNGNGIPDECEIFDCNDNDVPDECDIDSGASDDCQPNGVPDECEPDCNDNGVADTCDIVGGTSEDCNENDVADECEAGGDQDCNGNGVPDLCDLYGGSSRDCNDNAVPDECDVALDPSLDRDGDGIIDDCRFGMSMVPLRATGEYLISGNAIILPEISGDGERVEFETFVSGWDSDLDGEPRLRAYQGTIDRAGFTSGEGGSLEFARIPCTTHDDCRRSQSASGYCLDTGFCDLQTVVYVDVSRPDFVFHGLPAFYGTFYYDYLESGGAASGLWYASDSVCDPGMSKYGATLILDVSPDAEGTFRVGFMDDLRYTVFMYGADGNAYRPPGLNPAFIVTPADCNDNGAPDYQDILDGTSEDCNSNWRADECEIDESSSAPGGPFFCTQDCAADCNDNGIPDECDVTEGTSDDQNGNGLPDECEIRIYVDQDAAGAGDGTSWTDAYTDLQDALAYALSDVYATQIWVATGTYTPDGGSGDHWASFHLIGGVSIYGGFDGTENTLDERAGLFDQTILSGDLDGDDGPDFANNDENSVHVVRATELEATARLDGFTIAGGNTTGRGAGLYNIESSVAIANCIFTGNSSEFGGGMYNEYSTDVSLSACTFIGNLAHTRAGGLYNYLSTPILDACTFIGNTAASGGGGMVNTGESPTLINCTFVGNSSDGRGGGICNRYESEPTLINCTFSGNSAVENGGGMYNETGSSPTLSNCTFGANSAGHGRAVACDSPEEPDPSNVEMANCILWDDGDEIWNNDGSTITITYSDVQGGWPGDGNIDEDPLFADLDGDDDIAGTQDDNLRLAAGSPCIDAGDNDGVPPDVADLDGDGDTGEPTPFDLDGRPRFIESYGVVDTGNPGALGPPIVDMGAYEHLGDCNDNGVDDDEDIAGGTSEDCNENALPDECERDSDADGIIDDCDNCKDDPNHAQENSDGDTYGDVCDNCPADTNQNQADWDGDTRGDVCDNCPTIGNEDQADGDGDLYGDVCDNCPDDWNDDQADGDDDEAGDVCDNCVDVPNPGQANSDGDTLGDACDNCPLIDNEDQDNADGDLYGDACDVCPDNPDHSDLNDNGVPDCAEPVDIPTVSQWGALFLALSLLTGAKILLGRRRPGESQA